MSIFRKELKIKEYQPWKLMPTTKYFERFNKRKARRHVILMLGWKKTVKSPLIFIASVENFSFLS